MTGHEQWGTSKGFIIILVPFAVSSRLGDGEKSNGAFTWDIFLTVVISMGATYMALCQES